jgi:hypothetical protein
MTKPTHKLLQYFGANTPKNGEVSSGMMFISTFTNIGIEKSTILMHADDSDKADGQVYAAR